MSVFIDFVIIFITDLEFIDKKDVENENTLREYEESLRTGRSLKVGLYVV